MLPLTLLLMLIIDDAMPLAFRFFSLMLLMPLSFSPLIFSCQL